MKTILITGVSGTLGMSLVPFLLASGYQIYYLIREKNGKSPFVRLKEMGIIPQKNAILQGDITLPFCGIEKNSISSLKNQIDMILHCAADVRFDPRYAKEIWETNENGTRHMLQLAVVLNVPAIHHMSTAYVAGDAKKFDESQLNVGQAFRNPYEASKYEAEKLIRSSELKYSIYRPSIIVGHSVTGHSNGFDGFYGFFLAFFKLLQKIKRQEKKYLEQGICFNGNFVELQLWIPCSANSILNLVPIDWLAQMLINLITSESNWNQTFHLINPNPPKVQWVIERSLYHLGINEIQFGNFQKIKGEIPLVLRIFQKLLEDNIYLPYMRHEACFEQKNVSAVLGQKFLCCPQIDDIFLAKLINFAKNKNFGK